MEASVDVLFSAEVRGHFFEQFGLRSDYKKLGDFENYVFEVYQDDQPFVMRVTHSTHRDEADLISELDWLMYLHDKGLNVPQTYPSRQTKFVESKIVEDGSIFYASLFSKVPGAMVSINSSEFNEDLFFLWGKTIGAMHKVTKDYVPAEQIKKRPEWVEEDLLNIDKHIPVNEVVVVENTKKLIHELKGLPVNDRNYGLIHSDVHTGNFFLDHDQIYVFDFDDCGYHWYSSDIAIPLYYSVLYKKVDDKSEFASKFMSAFLKGYNEEYTLSPNFNNELPLLLRLRDVVLYAVLNKKIAPEDRSQNLTIMMKEIKHRIENEQVIVNIRR
ncbi:phosphotransferase [Cytobacillus spongiae]|jgi:Ser/Thr protein kinase RdoA (MazF antagonist)|uniref:phosphotransferase enzyme family protein n=1 Tax=Cytobacillus spongiae TaxID=2901381 RepID=UPI001F303A28|nr:phosphotransferase [Cytobacillus spongiae]UII57180.1 phosphotransferase [Cytobacillus spongiae]